jgi:NAD(P)-dependent dehydrogenase (short-subunit alcohol dehydrogenase family)
MSTVLITGAGRGLGLEFARQYAADGWDVIACVRDPGTVPELSALAKAHAPHVAIEALDAAAPASVAALAHRLGARPIDVLINSAGTMGPGNFAESGLRFGAFGSFESAAWHDLFALNVFGPVSLSEALVANVAASQQKKIVTLSSILGSVAGNSIGSFYAYRASKSAVNAIMKSMSVDLGRQHGIIAIPMHPGWVRTRMGGPGADIDAVTSVGGMRAVIAGLDAAKSGRFWAWDGKELPW